MSITEEDIYLWIKELVIYLKPRYRFDVLNNLNNIKDKFNIIKKEEFFFIKHDYMKFCGIDFNGFVYQVDIIKNCHKKYPISHIFLKTNNDLKLLNHYYCSGLCVSRYRTKKSKDDLNLKLRELGIYI